MENSKLLLRPWLTQLIESKEIPGLKWVNKEEQTFQIPWIHASSKAFIPDHHKLFGLWAEHTGKSDSGQVANKSRFRAALHALVDIQEVKKSRSKSFRVYRFLEPKRKSNGKRRGRKTVRHQDQQTIDSLQDVTPTGSQLPHCCERSQMSPPLLRSHLFSGVQTVEMRNSVTSATTLQNPILTSNEDEQQITYGEKSFLMSQAVKEEYKYSGGTLTVIPARTEDSKTTNVTSEQILTDGDLMNWYEPSFIRDGSEATAQSPNGLNDEVAFVEADSTLQPEEIERLLS